MVSVSRKQKQRAVTYFTPLFAIRLHA